MAENIDETKLLDSNLITIRLRRQPLYGILSCENLEKDLFDFRQKENDKKNHIDNKNKNQFDKEFDDENSYV